MKVRGGPGSRNLGGGKIQTETSGAKRDKKGRKDTAAGWEFIAEKQKRVSWCMRINLLLQERDGGG